MPNSFYLQRGKRIFDFISSLLGLFLLSPLFLLVAILIKVSSKGSIFYIQERIGKNFNPFNLYKFRSMREVEGLNITSKGDPRITKIGKFIRKTKIDELPQLLNVLKGEMSLVGPRPEMKKYVTLKKDDYSEILKIRPGITDTAAIEFRDEESILAIFKDIEQGYIEEVLPQKIELYKEYISNINFLSDVAIILKTLKVR